MEPVFLMGKELRVNWHYGSMSFKFSDNYFFEVTRYTFLRPSGRGVMYHKLHLMPQPAISLIYSLEIFSTIIHQFLFES